MFNAARTGPALAIASALLGTACAVSAAPAGSGYVATERSDADANLATTACPMQIEGADVMLSFVDGGAVFVFTAPSRQASAVQRAARRFASHYDTVSPSAEPGAAPQADRQTPLGIATWVAYSDIATGARVLVKAVDPREAISLQRRLHQEASRMERTKRCRLSTAAVLVLTTSVPA